MNRWIGALEGLEDRSDDLTQLRVLAQLAEDVTGSGRQLGCVRVLFERSQQSPNAPSPLEDQGLRGDPPAPVVLLVLEQEAHEGLRRVGGVQSPEAWVSSLKDPSAESFIRAASCAPANLALVRVDMTTSKLETEGGEGRLACSCSRRGRPGVERGRR